jgi:mono/diheme cytochrome c family protein
MRWVIGLLILLAALVLPFTQGLGGSAKQVAAGEAPADAGRTISYNRDIRPLLADNCYACHGPDPNTRKAKLRLDDEENAKAKRDDYFVLVPGKPTESELVRRLLRDDEHRMPPAKSGKRLTAAQIDLLKEWVAQGAKFEAHWSQITPTRPAVPAVKDSAWPANPIDRFVLARLEQEGLKPSPEADRRTLLRRLAFDLTGLPPSKELAEAFLKDALPDAYKKLVEQLFASKHYGERMAQHWLDLVRYGDTGGYHSDNHRDVWLFRDYVIDAFNANKPFDRFTTEQLAGDLLPQPSRDQLIASGYNRLLMTTEEGGAQAKEYAAKYMADRVRNASSVWLGATMGCAECHSHKFDPYTQKEFYRFVAFFADIREKHVGRQDQTPLPLPQQDARLQSINAELPGLQTSLAVFPWHVARATRARALQLEKDELTRTIPTTLISMAGPPRVIRVLPRGNWLDDTGEIVEPGTPASFPPLGVKDRRANRLDLANWITAKENPAAARVFVNRLWALFFGQGLVKTLDDFGTQGAWPTHPELLDWLAVEFRESGWDVRHMVRLMVTSRTYRQSSQATEGQRQRDPYNTLLARQSRWRLDAEFVRDNALSVSGLLVPKIGGPSVKPYQPAGYWQYLNFPKRDWTADKGEDQYRRGLYTYVQRTFPHPSLLAFDGSSREECTVERPRSNTPQQALVLLNDPSYVEAARVFAERLLRQGGKTPAERIHSAFEQALLRKAEQRELDILAPLYQKHLKQYQADPAAAAALLKTGDRPPPKDLDAAELAAWTSVARVILNLHETITRP